MTWHQTVSRCHAYVALLQISLPHYSHYQVYEDAIQQHTRRCIHLRSTLTYLTLTLMLLSWPGEMFDLLERSRLFTWEYWTLVSHCDFKSLIFNSSNNHKKRIHLLKHMYYLKLLSKEYLKNIVVLHFCVFCKIISR